MVYIYFIIGYLENWCNISTYIIGNFVILADFMLAIQPFQYSW